jgi:hypothetical protein
MRKGQGCLVDKEGVEKKGHWNLYNFEGIIKVPEKEDE